MSLSLIPPHLRMPAENRGTLQGLPSEMIQKIACFLPTDRDVGNLMKTCKRFTEVLTPPSSGIWRSMFLSEYDPYPPDKTSIEIKWEYQFRRIIFRKPITFENGEESFKYFGEGDVKRGRTSLNVEVLTKLLEDSEFFHRPIVGYNTAVPAKPTLRLERPFRALREDYDIAIAYGISSEGRLSLFNGGHIDLEQLLHVRNFWKRHLTSSEEYSFRPSYKTAAQPKAWDVAFGERLEFATSWTGYYSCIHPYTGIENLLERQTCADFGTHMERIPHVFFKIDSDPILPAMRQLLEHAFPSAPSAFDREWFSATWWAEEEEDYLYSILGYCESLPGTHGGSPGWRRACFMQYEWCTIGYEIFEDLADFYLLDPDQWKNYFEWVTGYEAVMLPGGQIMIGRWYNMQSDPVWEGGPLIFWRAP
ncbi:predicted protein [Uncinocarpus reesii 1704]|uniref:F-box domain-containing protein n=1 Tax=Uncinocarpus reesii (strain UAMH 1704) TaxID=336963 RepID=C4JT55_UNCRE|nr:uncharacterized protein UREG_05644 [Uncinocarpus reesii 1704]EEP80802.1 predicted protein [Uncinocarpus reesii 1704]